MSESVIRRAAQAIVDRQAATMEGAPPDPFISVGVTA